MLPNIRNNGKLFQVKNTCNGEKMKVEKTIDDQDIDLFQFTDSVEEARDYIQKYALDGFGLKQHKKIRPFGILGEGLISRNQHPE